MRLNMSSLDYQLGVILPSRLGVNSIISVKMPDKSSPFKILIYDSFHDTILNWSRNKKKI